MKMALSQLAEAVGKREPESAAGALNSVEHRLSTLRVGSDKGALVRVLQADQTLNRRNEQFPRSRFAYVMNKEFPVQDLNRGKSGLLHRDELVIITRPDRSGVVLKDGGRAVVRKPFWFAHKGERIISIARQSVIASHPEISLAIFED